MKAYKCDICGEYCESVYANTNDLFDIFPNTANKLGIGKNKIEIRDICFACHKTIQIHINNMYLENH